MITVSVAGIGLLGPGLPGWAASHAVLTGAEPWQHAEVALPLPTILPPTERRRTGPVARLALAVATEAAAASGLPPDSLRPVFGSGNGDSITLGGILDALTRPDGFVSPTQFHNSVHNAAAAYWSIGTGSSRPATCLGGHDWTFGATLLKSVAECVAEREPVLLCVYDVPLPSPLDVKRPMSSLFAVALVLAPEGSGPTLAMRWQSGQRLHPGDLPQAAGGDEPSSLDLRRLARSNPAGRALRLLEILARGDGGTVRIPLLDGDLHVAVAA